MRSRPGPEQGLLAAVLLAGLAAAGGSAAAAEDGRALSPVVSSRIGPAVTSAPPPFKDPGDAMVPPNNSCATAYTYFDFSPFLGTIDKSTDQDWFLTIPLGAGHYELTLKPPRGRDYDLRVHIPESPSVNRCPHFRSSLNPGDRDDRILLTVDEPGTQFAVVVVGATADDVDANSPYALHLAPYRGAAAAPADTSPAQACASSAWRRIAGPGDAAQLTVVAASAEAELALAGSVAADVANHLYRGAPAGPNWQPVPSLAATRVAAIAIGPGGQPTVTAAILGHGVVLSEDQAATFRELPGLVGAWTSALAFHAGVPLAAASLPDPAVRGVYAWNAAADTWERRGGGDIDTNILYGLASDGQNLWLATNGRGLLRSGDDGRTWNSITVAGLAAGSVRTVAVDPERPGVVAIGRAPTVQDGQSPGGEPAGLAVSLNGGAAWRVARPDLDTITAVVHGHGSTWYASAWGKGLVVSHDDGGSFAALSYPPGGQFTWGLATYSPGGQPECRLLVAVTPDGAYARNMATAVDGRAHLPTLAGRSPTATGAVRAGEAAGVSLPLPVPLPSR